MGLALLPHRPHGGEERGQRAGTGRPLPQLIGRPDPARQAAREITILVNCVLQANREGARVWGGPTLTLGSLLMEETHDNAKNKTYSLVVSVGNAGSVVSRYRSYRRCSNRERADKSRSKSTLK